jgi:flagellar assembly protein FliH
VSGGIELYEYEAAPDAGGRPLWNGWEDSSRESSTAAAPNEHSRRAQHKAPGDEIERQLAEEKRKGFDAGRERGRQERAEAERRALAAAQAAQEQERRHEAARLVESFQLERNRFLHAVEHEVVKLALAVAARILRREAQMDPLLLTGAVRVAFGQLADSTEVRLKVPQGDLDLWTEAVALVPNLAVRPLVVVGEGMRLGDCTVETELGTVDLGIRSQLGEIERGFFDRAGGVRHDARSGHAPASLGQGEAEP